MYDTDLKSVDTLSVVEGISEDPLGGIFGNELDGLNDTIDNDMFDTRVFAFGILADQDSVNTVIWSLISSNRSARSYVCEKIECTTEGKIERNVTFSNWSLPMLDISKVFRIEVEHTARGPLRATLFLSIDSTVSGAIEVLPSINLGVTSTGSHLIGAYFIINMLNLICRSLIAPPWQLQRCL